LDENARVLVTLHDKERLTMDSALSPREIQARIRSGARVADVADEAGVSVEDVEPFAVPVLAELDHVVSTALDGPIRHRNNPSSRRSLRSVVDRVATKVGFDPDDLTWSARRLADRSWEVCARWHGEQGPADPLSDDPQSHVATFRFDQHTRRSRPLDAGARWLTDDRVSASRTRETENPDEEPTVDLNDELAIVRAVSNRQSQTADPEAVAGMTKHDGVYDFDTSSPADTDMLYEMLAGFQEDSVNIYEGLATPVLDAASHPEVNHDPEPATPQAPQPAGAPHAIETSQPDQAGGKSEAQPPHDDTSAQDTAASKPRTSTKKPSTSTSRSQASAQAADETPQQDALVEEGSRPRKKRKPRKSRRASIPSWDEIMFGGPTPHT